DDLVIKDGKLSVALGGVMGGLTTEVTDKTTRVLLEAASFRALSVRRTARRLGLHSEASHRFERGVDPELAALASARAARLLCQLGGGRVLGELLDAYPRPHRPKAIALRMPRLRMLTGVALDTATARDALERLGCIAAGTGDVLDVTPPSPRADL